MEKVYSIRMKNTSIKETLLSIAKHNGWVICDNFDDSSLSEYPLFLFSICGGIDGINVYGSRGGALSVELVDFEKMIILLCNPLEIVEIELTGDYTAKIDITNKVVYVGCQAIPFNKLKEVYNIAFKVK